MSLKNSHLTHEQALYCLEAYRISTHHLLYSDEPKIGWVKENCARYEDWIQRLKSNPKAELVFDLAAEGGAI